MTEEEFAGADEDLAGDCQDAQEAPGSLSGHVEGASAAEDGASSDDGSDAEPDGALAGESGADAADGDDESNEDDGYEEVEIEFNEDDIEAYIVDEDDNEIGFIMLDEEGNEVEYYYTDDGEPDNSEEDNPYDLGITREGVAEATSNMNDIYRDGIAIASELKDAFTDIQEALDFSDLIPGKKKKK